MTIPPPEHKHDNVQRLKSLGVTWSILAGSMLLFLMLCVFLTALALDWQIIIGVTMFFSVLPGVLLLLFWRQNQIKAHLREERQIGEGIGDATTQGTPNFRAGQPAWIQELPRWTFQPREADPKFQLIKPEDLDEILSKSSSEQAAARIRKDMDFLDSELLRLFRERDHLAKLQQNRYRLYQIWFLILAATAAMFGSFQALALAVNSRWMLVWSFMETLVALLSVFLATISGREPPLPIWLSSRRRAEQLRREYFRYLMNLAPYDVIKDDKERQLKLSENAANINRGDFPSETGLI
jgi:Protein of unknown function (DUF4231)